MADQITCCPHCDTSFRVTDTQLDSARGAVRCGSCLQVFNATLYLLGSQDEDLSSAYEPEEFQPETAAPSFDIEIPDYNIEDGANEEAADSESVPTANELTDKDDAQISDGIDKPESLGVLSSELGGNSNHSSLFERPNNAKDKFEDNPSDESWALELMEDEEASPEAHYRQEDKSTDPQAQASDIEQLNASEEDNDTELKDLSALYSEEDPAQISDDEYAEDMAQLIQAIHAAPVEMHSEDPYALLKKLAWFLLCLLSATALAAQIGYYKFNDLSRMEPYRGIYSELCPLLGCKLPSIEDPSRIKAYNLVVRSHPRKSGALMIDCILLNTAPFTQSFPDLILSFSDLQGQAVASRRFTPDEYLGGEMAGANKIPKNQPVHVSLEIVDPGANAVNYNIHIPSE